MSQREEDIGFGETEEPQPEDDGRIELGAKRYTPDELAEAIRFKEQDYPNLQRRFSQAQEEHRQTQGRVAELEDMLAASAPPQEPYGQRVEPYYGQPVPGQGQSAYGTQDDVVRAIASQVERAIAPRLASVERVTKELQTLRQEQEQMRHSQQRLVQIESEYSELRDRYGLEQADLNAVAQTAREYQDRTGQYLDAEHAYRSHQFEQAMKEEQTAEAKRRKRASAAEPGSAEGVVLPEKTPQTEADWSKFADRVLNDITSGGEL